MVVKATESMLSSQNFQGAGVVGLASAEPVIGIDKERARVGNYYRLVDLIRAIVRRYTFGVLRRLLPASTPPTGLFVCRRRIPWRGASGANIFLTEVATIPDHVVLAPT